MRTRRLNKSLGKYRRLTNSFAVRRDVATGWLAFGKACAVMELGAHRHLKAPEETPRALLCSGDAILPDPLSGGGRVLRALVRAFFLAHHLGQLDHP